VAASIDHFEFRISPPECERFDDDIAVLAIGALDGVEKCRLLRHLDACARCEALREDYAVTAEALQALIPVGTEPRGLLHRIMDAVRL
jgi:hypothetical protein